MEHWRKRKVELSTRTISTGEYTNNKTPRPFGRGVLLYKNQKLKLLHRHKSQLHATVVGHQEQFVVNNLVMLHARKGIMETGLKIFYLRGAVYTGFDGLA